MNLNRATILATLAANREPIRSLGARRLGLFGSHARSEASEGSDLDFVVEFEPGAKSFDGYMDLKELLETLFGRRVDLVINEVIKPRLRERILAETIYAPGL